ncbi:MAG TPA: septum formation initiator family protein [Bryobacteraceae bacterium]|nr:septum formation initiator family protein [Bryobacteraceae bacterium]
MHPLIQRTALLVCFTLVATYAFVTFQGPHGIAALMEKRRQISALQEENATLAAENERLAVTVDALAKKPSAQKLKIRERLKLIQPGETQLMLPNETPASQPAK